MHDIGDPGGSAEVANLRMVPALRIDASDGSYFVYGVTEIREELARLDDNDPNDNLNTGWTRVE